MNVFALHLWREWREHRFALASLAVLLPLGAWLVSEPLSRGTIGDPLFRFGVTLAFAGVALVVVGGELLGLDRRGAGLRWLERLPAGLAAAFRAKLAFFGLTLSAALAYGWGVAWLIGLSRLAPLLDGARVPKALPLLTLAAVWSLWTFAASAWALRGGLALLAAGLLLAAFGYPFWRLVDAGYRPTNAELQAWIVSLAPSVLLGAWLAFVHGARLGRGTLVAAVLGLAPAAPVFVAAWIVSAHRLEQRGLLDPEAEDFLASSTIVTRDGRHAFVVGHNRRANWDPTRVPLHAMHVDLVHETVERLGGCAFTSPRYRLLDTVSFEADELLVQVEEGETPLVFGLERGEPRAWTPRKKEPAWFWRGLGRFVMEPGEGNSIHDPFRGLDFGVEDLGHPGKGHILVRPGRWLYHAEGPEERWEWFEPETRERTPVGWPEGTSVLVLFTDGRVVIANEELGLRVVHPENGTSRVLDSHGIAPEDIYTNWGGARVPGMSSRDPGPREGTIVLKTSRQAWLVLDAEATTVRRVDVGDEWFFMALAGADAAIVSNGRQLARLDLANGERTVLWPTGRER